MRKNRNQIGLRAKRKTGTPALTQASRNEAFFTAGHPSVAAPATGAVQSDRIDVDLTQLSSTMVYSEVYSMLTEPEIFLGKKIKMKGSFAYAQGDGRYYFACIIADATACCSQGIEFVLGEERSFPDEYPGVGEEITVEGIFDTYYEGENRYCQLINAEMC
ncbi:MAG: hypothetical protein IJV00_02530 [Clostridia bacterium]|nr:hypothetical protein [Clostridia bacterium]